MALDVSAQNDFSSQAEVLRLLSHPIRLKIIVGLMDSACCVKDIWSCLEMPQATVSQHLAVLRAHGIVKGEREGTSITYKVVDPFVKEFINWFRKQNGLPQAV